MANCIFNKYFHVLCSWVNFHVNILDGELDRTSAILEEVLNGVIANVCVIALVPASIKPRLSCNTVYCPIEAAEFSPMQLRDSV